MVSAERGRSTLRLSGSIKAAQSQAKTSASSKQAIGMLKHALEPIWEALLEVGFVKIVYTERVQDGVERLGYAVGLEAVKAVQKQESHAVENFRGAHGSR